MGGEALLVSIWICPIYQFLNINYGMEIVFANWYVILLSAIWDVKRCMLWTQPYLPFLNFSSKNWNYHYVQTNKFEKAKKNLTWLVNRGLVTCSQLFEGLKSESQTKNSEKINSWGMLPGSPHFGGVQGHARALGWDFEELTRFTYSHGPTKNQHKVVSA